MLAAWFKELAHAWFYPFNIRAWKWENLSSGFLTKWDSNQPAQLQTGLRKLMIDQDFLIEHWHMIYIMSVVFAEIYVWMKLKLNFRYKISINWLVSIDICYFKPLINDLKIAFSPFWSQPTYFPDWEWLTVLIPVQRLARKLKSRL